MPPATTSPTITVDNLSKQFKVPVREEGLKASIRSLVRREHRAVDAVAGVSFAIEPGEVVGFLGPNGAGKTTTLEMIEGLRRPDAGEVRLLGESPWPRNMRLLPRIGVQLQASAFFERLTARE